MSHSLVQEDVVLTDKVGIINALGRMNLEYLQDGDRIYVTKEELRKKGFTSWTPLEFKKKGNEYQMSADADMVNYYHKDFKKNFRQFYRMEVAKKVYSKKGYRTKETVENGKPKLVLFRQKKG